MAAITRHQFLDALTTLFDDPKIPSNKALAQRVLNLFEQQASLQVEDKELILRTFSCLLPVRPLHNTGVKKVVAKFFPPPSDQELTQKLNDLQQRIAQKRSFGLSFLERLFEKDIQTIHQEWVETHPGLGMAALELLFDSSYEETDTLCQVIAKSLALSPPQQPENHPSPLRQKLLVAMAKIAAAQNGWETSQYIQNYGITDEQARIKIAKIAAAQSGRATSQYIQNYGITDEQALIEIAKIAAAKDAR